MSSPEHTPLVLQPEQVVQLYEDFKSMLRDDVNALNLGIRDPAFNAFAHFIEDIKAKGAAVPLTEFLHFVYSICDIHSTRDGWSQGLIKELNHKVKFLEGRVEELEGGR